MFGPFNLLTRRFAHGPSDILLIFSEISLGLLINRSVKVTSSNRNLKCSKNWIFSKTQKLNLANKNQSSYKTSHEIHPWGNISIMIKIWQKRFWLKLLYILIDRGIKFYFLLWPSPVAWYLFSWYLVVYVTNFRVKCYLNGSPISVVQRDR